MTLASEKWDKEVQGSDQVGHPKLWIRRCNSLLWSLLSSMISPFLSLQSAFTIQRKPSSRELEQPIQRSHSYGQERENIQFSFPKTALTHLPALTICSDGPHILRCERANWEIWNVFDHRRQDSSLVKTHFSLWLVFPDILVLWWQLVSTSHTTSKPSDSFWTSAFCLALWFSTGSGIMEARASYGTSLLEHG